MNAFWGRLVDKVLPSSRVAIQPHRFGSSLRTMPPFWVKYEKIAPGRQCVRCMAIVFIFCSYFVHTFSCFLITPQVYVDFHYIPLYRLCARSNASRWLHDRITKSISAATARKRRQRDLRSRPVEMSRAPHPLPHHHHRQHKVSSRKPYIIWTQQPYRKS